MQTKSAQLKDSIPGGDESTQQDQVGGGDSVSQGRRKSK